MICIKAFWVIVLVGQMIIIEGMATVPGGNGIGAGADCLECMHRAVGAGSWKTQAKDLLQNVNIHGPDDRVDQSRLGGKGIRFAPIGRAYTNRVFRNRNGDGFQKTGSGFLVSPCIALVNFHLPFGLERMDEIIAGANELKNQFMDNSDSQGVVKITLPNEKDYSITFQVGEKPDGTFAKMVVGRPVAFGNMSKQGSYGADWTAIKFKEPNCPGTDERIGWMALQTLPLEEIQKLDLHTAGFTLDHNPRITDKATLSLTARNGRAYERITK
jgi:hypothetical protein